jgi:hypothetical protein
MRTIFLWGRILPTLCYVKPLPQNKKKIKNTSHVRVWIKSWLNNKLNNYFYLIEESDVYVKN